MYFLTEKFVVWLLFVVEVFCLISHYFCFNGVICVLRPVNLLGRIALAVVQRRCYRSCYEAE